MLTLLFVILMFVVFGKILMFALKAAWGISKIIVSVVLLPIILIAMALTGLLSVALVLLIGIGLVSFIGGLIIG
ncbi:MAG: hypothetical protein IJ661_09250 [Lachnospiraceae bacterium]|nr:hypothetical protein [Lachnospiraceae bacterium]